MAFVWDGFSTLARDYIHLPVAVTTHTDGPRLQPGVQCTRPLAVCCQPSRHTQPVFTRCVVGVWACIPISIQSPPPHHTAHIPLFLYPFLNTVSKTRPFEYLRLTSLGVIGALVKVDDTEVINFLLSTEIIPLCLRTMEKGSELSKTVATFIVQKILLDNVRMVVSYVQHARPVSHVPHPKHKQVGLNYICATAERFFAVSTVLSNMVSTLQEQPSVRLLKHIVRCYLRLSENLRAREALRQCLPDNLRNTNYTACLNPDTKRWLAQLLINVGYAQDAAALVNEQQGMVG